MSTGKISEVVVEQIENFTLFDVEARRYFFDWNRLFRWYYGDWFVGAFVGSSFGSAVSRSFSESRVLWP